MEKCQKNRNLLPPNEPWMLIHVSERINAFPTQNTTFLGFNNSRRFTARAEYMNAFPTKYLAKHKFDKKPKHKTMPPPVWWP